MPRTAMSSMMKRSRPERHGRQPLKPGSSGTVRVTLRAATRSSNDEVEARATCISVTATLRLGTTVLGMGISSLVAHESCARGALGRHARSGADCLREAMPIHIARWRDEAGRTRRSPTACLAHAGYIGRSIRHVEGARDDNHGTQGPVAGQSRTRGVQRRFRDSFVDAACELKAELADLTRPRRK